MLKLLFLIILINPLIGEIYIYNKDFVAKKTIKSWIEFKNENIVRQKYDYSCGSASLSTILKYYYNYNIEEKDILDYIFEARGLDSKDKVKYKKGDLPLSFFDLSWYSQKKDFKTIGLALDLSSLSYLKAPVILFVKIRNNEHFTVYKSMDLNYVYLADPSFGNIKVSISKFKEMFYQRDDLTYPGKILAIVPPSNKTINISNDFIQIPKSSNLIYENIKNDISIRE